MCSIRTRITAMMLAAILISIFFGAISIYSVRTETNRMTAKNMDLVCKNRKDSLDQFILSIEQSVNMMAGIAIDSLDSQALIDGGVIGAAGSGTLEIAGKSDKQRQELDRYFDEHLDLVELAFKSVANHTNGVSTCYYRINPEITTTAKGFYYSKRGTHDFEKLNLTEIEAYDPGDLEQVGWYYIPLNNGGPKGPEDVIGLSDSLIFNESTANRFVQDDTMTLAMDRPYIFYEDVPDPLGNRRQFQATRLKYFDESGKLCILGMFQDVTDMIRIQRESATNKEAY